MLTPSHPRDSDDTPKFKILQENTLVKWIKNVSK